MHELLSTTRQRCSLLSFTPARLTSHVLAFVSRPISSYIQSSCACSLVHPLTLFRLAPSPDPSVSLSLSHLLSHCSPFVVFLPFWSPPPPLFSRLSVVTHPASVVCRSSHVISRFFFLITEIYQNNLSFFFFSRFPLHFSFFPHSLFLSFSKFQFIICF